MTRLVTVAHGTRHATGNEVAAEITAAAAARLGWPATTAYVELNDPLFADVVAGLDGDDAVAVPLLLSTGFHVRHDLPEAIAAAGRAASGVRLGRALGPDPLLASAQVDRLDAADARRGQALVLVAAGSNDPAASPDLDAAGRFLAAAWGAPVRVAVLSGDGPRIADVVRQGDAVSPYLLAAGYFADRARAEALAAGAAVVAEVVGPHPAVVELVAARARALISGP